ncbi:hypothetical protein M3936_10130 [Sutcliffiella horikoshii]|uniref:hypothetical protein n=1 Tax=Sutcliffiella horikoshii TaxID=79883 RepID=UPI0020425455|nr:hypothetical protein [Sutcliffiella horikoshii]MCM3617936.1 hypothetical protein [Sutcliffiella horikoshii]
MRRRRGNPILVLIIALALTVVLVYLFSSIFLGSERKARKVVHEFYEFESEADFGRSWELLHTEMQGRFGRGAYVQDRAHVFNGHFEADTFTFDISGAKKIKNWKMDKDGEAFDFVYAFEVEQEYHGKYGHFVFVQYVYVVKEDGEWRVLWDYKG